MNLVKLLVWDYGDEAADKAVNKHPVGQWWRVHWRKVSDSPMNQIYNMQWAVEDDLNGIT